MKKWQIEMNCMTRYFAVASITLLLAACSTGKVPHSKAANQGYLTVNSIPFGAVHINQDRIQNTPLVKYPLDAGRYTLEVKRKGFRDFKKEITVRTSQTIVHSVNLVKKKDSQE